MGQSTSGIILKLRQIGKMGRKSIMKMFGETAEERRADLDRRLEEIRAEGREARRIMTGIVERRAEQDAQLASCHERLERAGLLTVEERDQRARWLEAVRIGEEVRRIEEEDYIRNKHAVLDAERCGGRRRGVFGEAVAEGDGPPVANVAGVRRLRSTSAGRGDDDEWFDAVSGGGGGGGGGGGAGGRRGPEGPWEIFLAFVQILLLVSKSVFCKSSLN